MNKYEVRMTEGNLFEIEADELHVSYDTGKLYLRIIDKEEGGYENIFVAHENRWDSIRRIDED